MITVVTVSFNAVSCIEETILSVINQTYLNLQYIIVDGGSTDGTVDIIKKYADKISYWISEPDKGIYDAMNKGIDMAKGEWINFMNSGDTFYANDTIESIFLQQHTEDIIYGDVQLSFEWGKIIKRARNINEIIHGMIFCHQSSFVKIDIMRANKFNLEYKIAADYHFFLKMYEQRKKYKYVGFPISVFEAETGLSSRREVDALIDKLKVQGCYGSNKGQVSIIYCRISGLFRKCLYLIFSHNTIQKMRMLHLKFIKK